MELSHRFTVPIGVEETRAHFNDIAAVAECFPGAQVTEADEESFAGSVKVKLGPIALQYNGSRWRPTSRSPASPRSSGGA